MIDLSGQTALVTGASRSIGAAIAHALVDAGAKVTGIGTSIEQNPPAGITARNCDLSDRDQISDLLEVLAGTQIDILVNNAGIIRRAPVAKYDIDDWDAVRAVNLDAPFILSQALGSRMVERGHGRIINIASVLSQQGGIMVPSYAATKAALANLTRSFANEWAISGVNVNAIAPGYVATANTAALQSDPEREAQLMARIPIGRWLRPEEIAAPVVFLASPMASAVHGTILNVDGGWCAR
ncbi:SDR family oxidoreductase [Thalassospira sp.]|uniref:SDR family oxidoreductase n=1 Tax=Thalassospira sp. TaxID=1912094 RepID=UPI001B2098BF|nr:SDR family oxidoreductase [Thalassospira sp.]MBO6808225.1 SDR family oxidoreductase [Thalassospira sp.]MBO6839402.1 SDR family oxidoreductase [Thalassospira sp.]